MDPRLAFLTIVIGWAVTIIVGLVALVIIWKMFTGAINLATILNESGSPKASLSRLQFLIFTFVIALSLFLVTVGGRSDKPGEGMKLPDVPAGIFALLGISSGTYLVSKGVQANKDVEMTKANNANV